MKTSRIRDILLLIRATLSICVSKVPRSDGTHEKSEEESLHADIVEPAYTQAVPAASHTTTPGLLPAHVVLLSPHVTVPNPLLGLGFRV